MPQSTSNIEPPEIATHSTNICKNIPRASVIQMVSNEPVRDHAMLTVPAAVYSTILHQPYYWGTVYNTTVKLPIV